MSVSLVTLVSMITLLVLRTQEIVLPRWGAAYIMPVLLAGAVGYLTNMIAVTMLFRPYGPGDDHPAGLVPGWNQGLIPRHKDDLAVMAGKQVADRLLTPEVVANEIKTLVRTAFEDKELRSRLRYTLGPMIRERLPNIVDAMSPQIMDLLRDMLAEGFSRENLDKLFTTVIDPWLRTGANQQRLVDTIVGVLRSYVPQIVEKMQAIANDYRAKSLTKRIAVKVAEITKALDWDEVRATIDGGIGNADTRERIIDALANASERFRLDLAQSDVKPLIQALQARASDFVIVLVEGHLAEKLPGIGHRVADDPRFWRWLVDQGVPSLQPYLMAWLSAEGVEVVKKGFDVAGRVREAVDRMDIAEMHEMINEASARHLGAIQVLGYILGVIAGVLWLFV